MGEIIIIILSILIIIASLMVLFSKTPINAAIALVSMMVFLASLYAIIGLHFLAVLQLIVYAGAIMVLFVFSIMLLNFNEEKKVNLKQNLPKVFFGGTFALVVASLMFKAFYDFSMSSFAQKGEFTSEVIKSHGGNVQALSEMLFADFYLHFELLSFVILVALIGAIVIAKKKASY